MNNKSGYYPEVVILLIIIIFLVAGLTYIVDRKSTYNRVHGEKVIESPINTKIVIVDKCEYLMYESYARFIGITHKGNCSNPIHVYRTEK